MPSSSVCWGIEIGAGAIKALKLEAAGDGVKVLDFAVIPHKLVLSTPDLDEADATRLALGTLVSHFDLSGAGIAMSVPGHAGFARFAKLPPVDKKNVPKIVRYEAVQQIPFPIEEVEWDYQTFISPDSPDVEVGIFAITRDRILERLAMYQDVQLVPDVMTLSPLSAYNALAYDLAFSEQTPGTIILDVGTTSTDLIVAEAGRVWIRTFPIGGHQFTEALVSAFKLSYTKAEKLKREAEQSKHARHIFQAMRPVFADLAQDVQRSIGYYQSLHPDANLVRLIGLGSTFRLPGLRKYLKQQLQLDVYRMEQFKRVSVDGPRSAEFHAASLNMATAYGLALQGLGLNAIEANLMPGAVLREVMWRRKVKWFAIAAGITVAAGATMFLRPFWDSTAVAGATPDPIIRNVISEATTLKSEASEVTGGDATDYRAAKLMEMLDGHDVYAHVVDDLSLMLEDADVKTGTPGTFRLEKLITKYKSPLVSKSKKSRSTPRDRGGGKAGGMGRGEPGIAPPGLSSRGRSSSRGEDLLDTKLEPSKNPRIFIQVEVSTTQPDPQKLLLTTLNKWLAEHAEREGVPYKIVMGSSVTWKKLGEREIAAPDEPAKGSGQQARSPARGGRGGRGGRGMVAPPGDVIITGAPQIAQGVQNERATRAQGVASLEQIAPLPAPPPEAEPGTKIVTFAVAWEVELVRDDSEEGE